MAVREEGPLQIAEAFELPDAVYVAKSCNFVARKPRKISVEYPLRFFVAYGKPSA